LSRFSSLQGIQQSLAISANREIHDDFASNRMVVMDVFVRVCRKRGLKTVATVKIDAKMGLKES